MSLRVEAAADFKNILDADNDDVTLTKPAVGETAAVDFEIKGQVTRVDAAIDPQTNTQGSEPKTAVTVSLADLDGETPDETWTVSTTDVMGTAVSGHVVSPMFDRTLGRLTFFIEVTE
jgi:hypothetical protein